MGRPLLFALNGEKVELTEVDPRTTVLQYIRSQTSLQGTKFSCGEGGCGACTVVLSKYNISTKRVEELTINSCLAPLCSIDGCAITTTEGLKVGPSRELHAVIKRIAGFHASQCGFCTPGMSMSMYGGLRKATAAKKSGAGELSNGNAKAECNGHTKTTTPELGLTALQAAKCIAGNICRCTGYRPILDACKSFSCDVDVEDLGLNAFWSSKQDADAASLPPYNPQDDPKFPQFLIDALETRKNSQTRVNGVFFKHVEGSETRSEHLWITAGSLSEVFGLLEHHNDFKTEIKLVVGNTSAGVYKNLRPQVFIDISQVPELKDMTVSHDSVEIGAGVSLTKLIDLLENQKENVVFASLAEHVRKIASEQVRNRASIGGNLVLAQKLGFDSDLATILLGAGTEVTVASSAQGRRTVLLEEFLALPILDAGTVLVSVRIPSWSELSKDVGRAGGRLLFKTYRVSCRPDGNAVSYINAALLAIVSDQSAKGRSGELLTSTLREVRLAFGAFGGAHAIRAHNTEKILTGKRLTPSILLDAVKELKNEIRPPPSVRKSAYRTSVAVGFLFDFFYASGPSTSDLTPSSPLVEEAKVAQIAMANGHHSHVSLSKEKLKVTQIELVSGHNSHVSLSDENPKVPYIDMANGHNSPVSLSEGKSKVPQIEMANGHDSAVSLSEKKSKVLQVEMANGHNNPASLSEGQSKVSQIELAKGDHTPVSLYEEKSSLHPVLSDVTANETIEVEFGTKKSILSSKRTSEELSSAQKFATSKEFWPVAQPTKKIAVELQASGEAIYVDDISPVRGTLYATLVLSDARLGKLVSIDTSEALKSPGVVDFVGHQDVTGTNVSYFFWTYQDRLFVEDRVECPHDVLGVLVADSYEHARDAAAKVVTKVEEEPGVYTMEEAIAAESYGDPGIFGFAASTAVGELPTKSDCRIENAEVGSGSQYYFYMETHTAFAVPDEDGCLTVYSSSQSPNSTQRAIAACLGIPMNCIRVIVRRLGGAFGGKVTKSSSVAVSCALAAYKLKRPVRMCLDRQTDMRLTAGRHEMKALYSVDFNRDGKITGLNTKVYVNGGRSKDISGVCVSGISQGLKQYNWGALKNETKICKTSRVNRGIIRGPGDVQGHFIAETVIEHVAAYLGLDPYEVREKNMHSLESITKFFPGTSFSVDSFTLPYIWHKLKDDSQFDKRRVAVEKFNKESKWEKRGLDIVVGLYKTGMMQRQARVSIFDDGSIVVEVGGTEMGQGLWTKVRQAVAYGLSKLWGPNAHPLERIDMSRIRVVQNDSLSLPNSEVSGGSTTSEASCQAALVACGKLVESFQPFLKLVRESAGTPAPWEAIVGMAKFGGTDLSAQGLVPMDPTTAYVNYGACISEVVINVLTGSTTILQTDLLYDCGRSLNPAVDIGQVEGAFIMGVGFYMTEEWHDEKGMVISDGTWTYKPPTADNIPKRFHVELSNTKANKERILSSKASGEPPLLLAKSVHSAIRQAIKAAREDLQQLPELAEDEIRDGPVNMKGKTDAFFRLDAPASVDKVKTLCGLNNVERYLASL